jgi:ElaA protein
VSPGVELRAAAVDDIDVRTAYLLWQLREAAFVVEQECAYQELDGRDLEPGTVHVWASLGGTPVGYLRVLEDPGSSGARLKIGRVVVSPSQRGRGIAGALLRRALAIIGDRPSHLDAQSHLAGWYAGFGYRPCGEEFVEDGIPHTPMSRD